MALLLAAVVIHHTAYAAMLFHQALDCEVHDQYIAGKLHPFLTRFADVQQYHRVFGATVCTAALPGF